MVHLITYISFLVIAHNMSNPELLFHITITIGFCSVYQAKILFTQFSVYIGYIMCAALYDTSP